MSQSELNEVKQEYHKQQQEYLEFKKTIRDGVADGLQEYRRRRYAIDIKTLLFVLVGSYLLLNLLSYSISIYPSLVNLPTNSSGNSN